jgi:hypothetical protein
MLRNQLKYVKDSFRFGLLYRKGIYLSAVIMVIIAIAGTSYSLKYADASSIQSGITIITEILGVLLGAVLVIVVFLVEQGQRAEERLLRACPVYRRKIESKIGLVEKAIDQLSRLVKSKKITLDQSIPDPMGAPLATKYGDVIGNLVGLKVAVDNSFEHYEKVLADIGFTKEEKDEYIYGQGATADFDSAQFLKLIEDALDANCLFPLCSDDVGTFALDIFQGYSHDGISQAISHSERSRRVLRSRVLAACITSIMSSMALAIVTLFGITEQSLKLPGTISIVTIVIAGFFVSVLLTLVLAQQMFFS